MTPIERQRYLRALAIEQSGQEELRRRLAWRHGDQRATAMIEGRDPAYETDLEAWRQVGRP